jgi:hypothetical protein
MNKQETPRRKPVMRGAMEGGCAGWAPIRPAGNDAQAGSATAGTDPLITLNAVNDSGGTASSAPDAER